MSGNEELIHQDYSHYYEQHSLAGTLEVFLPLVKMDLMMDYVCKAPMDVIEEYICRCIVQGMTDRYAIMDALALEGEMVDYEVEKLIDQKILIEQGGKLTFADANYALEEDLRSIQTKRREVTWCYKGLMNADKKIDTHMQSLETAVEVSDMLDVAHHFYLLPNVLLEVKAEELKVLNSKMLHYPEEDQEEIMKINQLEMIKERTVLYEAYKVLFFKGTEGNVKLLVHELGGSEKVDQAFTRTLQRLYDRSELYSQLRPTTKGDEERLVELNKQIGSKGLI